MPNDIRNESPMNTWTREELDKVGAAEELALAPLQRVGTQRKPVTIWVVRVGDELCVRSVNGAPPDGFAAPRYGTKAELARAESRKK